MLIQPRTAGTSTKAGCPTLVLSSSFRSSWGLSRSWFCTNSSSMSSQSFTRSSFSRRSLHLALGVIVGSLVPKLEPLSRRFCLRPTLAGAAGGSHFFFLSCGSYPFTQLYCHYSSEGREEVQACGCQYCGRFIDCRLAHWRDHCHFQNLLLFRCISQASVQ